MTKNLFVLGGCSEGGWAAAIHFARLNFSWIVVGGAYSPPRWQHLLTDQKRSRTRMSDPAPYSQSLGTVGDGERFLHGLLDWPC